MDKEPPTKEGLLVSVVVYRSDPVLLARTFECLGSALGPLEIPVEVVLIDNDGATLFPAGLRERQNLRIERLHGHGNIGYGRGHNLTLNRTTGFHLILNPDVECAPDALIEALSFMSSNPECGLLTPAVFDPKGRRQYLCKRYPGVWDLLLRGFSPNWLKKVFRQRLARYEMRDLIADNVVWDPELVSGCFMLIRGKLFKHLGGFDPAFFLYFEDYDLSLRAAKSSRIAYVPAVRITHHGGNAAGKGWRHLIYFTRSAFLFFNRHGWRWW